jgi:hypothetical protein
MGGISPPPARPAPIYAAGVLYIVGTGFRLDVPAGSPVIAADFAFVATGKYTYTPSFLANGIDWYSITPSDGQVADAPTLADCQEPGGLPTPFLTIFVRQSPPPFAFSDEKFFLVFSGT